MKKRTIYIVDDDMVYQYAAQKSLEKIIQDDEDVVKVFSDGEQVFNFIYKNLNNVEELPDLIFLDLNMPIMDGWEFLDKYSSIKDKVIKEPSIFIVSSSDDDTDTERAQKIEFVKGYLIKPMYSDQFSEILNNF